MTQLAHHDKYLGYSFFLLFGTAVDIPCQNSKIVKNSRNLKEGFEYQRAMFRQIFCFEILGMPFHTLANKFEERFLLQPWLKRKLYTNWYF